MILERFSTVSNDSSLTHNGNTRILLTGGANTGKTSLAFKFAYDEASSGGVPLFICNQNKLESKLPLNVILNDGYNSMKMSPDVLRKILMKYVTSMNELKAVIAGLHAFSPTPTLVIIDDLSLLIDPLHSVQRNDPSFLEICSTLGAYLDDALSFLHEKKPLSSQSKIQLLITDPCDETLFLSVLQRSIPMITKLIKTTDSSNYTVVALPHTNIYNRAPVNIPVLSKIELYQGGLIAHI